MMSIDLPYQIDLAGVLINFKIRVVTKLFPIDVYMNEECSLAIWVPYVVVSYNCPC